MILPFYQVDAFTSELFHGNPAGVCPLQAWLPNKVMQQIAAENNLAETAFFIPQDNGFEIKWFTPKTEVDLCGHATLASAHVIFNYLEYQDTNIKFNSRSGPLEVTGSGSLLTLNFPADFCDPAKPPDGLFEAIGNEPILCYKGKTDFMLVYGKQKDVEDLSPDFGKLRAVEARGVIVTAPGNEADFVSRFFAPQVGINEDPVTGSAHTTLTPYWSRALVKTEMFARQLSERGGQLWVKMMGNRVEISGNAKTYLKGEIEIPG